MSKISELSDGGSLVSTDYLIAVRSGGNVKVQMDTINVDQVDLGDNEFIRLGNSQDLTLVHTSTQSIINQAGVGDLLLQKAGTTKASITANGLEFPDNSKAIFGAGSDLQIYHDGTDSYITDTGTGDLLLQGTNIQLRSASTKRVLQGIEAGTTKIFYDNAEKLSTTSTGIDITGTATMDGITTSLGIDVDGTDDLRVRFLNGGSFKGGAQVVTTAGDMITGSAVDDVAIRSQSNMLFATGGATERLRIDSLGNVGIGTDSPSYNALLDVNGIIRANVGSGGLSLSGYSAPDIGYFSYNYTNSNGTEVVPQSIRSSHRLSMGNGTQNAITFDYRAPNAAAGTWAERMRIDSSGSLLVGGTSTNPTGQNVAGAAIDATGEGNFSVDGAEALRLNRKQDGDILKFMAAGTTVGSIGVTSGSLGVGQSNTGLGFFNTDSIVFPATAAGATRDAAIDLGYSGSRFKDLYLSGGVYLGGTAAANHLDDYEEGTWSPVYADDSDNVITNLTNQVGKYVKVGNLVYISGCLRTQGTSDASGLSGSLNISGLPFTQETTEATGQVTFYTHQTAGSYNAPLELPRSSPVLGNTTKITIYKYSGTGGRTTRFAVSDLNMTGNSNFMFFSGTYKTA